MTVPATAIGSDGKGEFVLKVEGNRVARAAVKTGLNDGSRVEVIEGLSEGDAVVSTAKGAPPAGAEVRVAAKN